MSQFLTLTWTRTTRSNGPLQLDNTQLESARRYGKSPYGKHLQGIVDGEIRLVDNSKTQD